MTDQKHARQLIEQVNKFIEYARYELQPGEPTVGSQFPHQADADRAIAKLNKVAGLLSAPVQETAAPRYDVPPNTRIVTIFADGSWLEETTGGTRKHASLDVVGRPDPTAPASGSPLPLEHSRTCSAGFADDACTCGLSWRIRLATEQEMHAAWRKRAEEAEARESSAPTLRQIEALRRSAVGTRYDTVAMFEQTAWNSALDAVLALLPAPGEGSVMSKQFWRPIATAPKGKRVLIGGGDCPRVHENELRCFGSAGCCWSGLGDKEQPTHWMPMPDPPERLAAPEKE